MSMNRILSVFLKEPAIISALGALLSAVLLTVLDVIEMAGGEWSALVLALAGAAGVTRQNVSPTNG